MDMTADNSYSPNLSDADSSESAPSTPDPNLSKPRSPWLSDAVQFSNSSDVVYLSSDESDETPLQKKKLTDFFKPAKPRTPAFPNALCRYEAQPGGVQEQTATAWFAAVGGSAFRVQPEPANNTNSSIFSRTQTEGGVRVVQFKAEVGSGGLCQGSHRC